MNSNKKISITIASVVHNSEKRIASFLKALSLQNQEYIRIKKILILSDGSTDRTIEEIKRCANRKVELIVGRKHLGTTKRLNEIFKESTGDVLVVLDIDTVLKDKFVIENLVAPFRSRKDVALVGGNPKPLPPNTFLESAAQNYYQARELLKRTINEGNNIYGLDKRIIALSKSFVDKVKIPSDLDTGDTFIYLKCKDENLEFVHQEQAIVWFRLPQSIADHIHHIKGINNDSEKIKDKFPKDLVDQELNLAKSIQIKVFLYQFINNPAGYLTLAPHTLFTTGKSLIRQIKRNPPRGKGLPQVGSLLQ